MEIAIYPILLRTPIRIGKFLRANIYGTGRTELKRGNSQTSFMVLV